MFVEPLCAQYLHQIILKSFKADFLLKYSDIHQVGCSTTIFQVWSQFKKINFKVGLEQVEPKTNKINPIQYIFHIASNNEKFHDCNKTPWHMLACIQISIVMQDMVKELFVRSENIKTLIRLANHLTTKTPFITQKTSKEMSK